MVNTFNNINDAAAILAKMAAGALVDRLQFTKSIAKADKSDYDGKNGYGAGDTIQISVPAQFLPQSTFDITSSIQDVKERKVPLTLDTIGTVGIAVNSFELATDIQLKSIFKRAVLPGVQAIAQDIEARFLVKAVNSVYNVVGTPGTTTFDIATVLAARTRMNKGLCPKDDMRYFLHESESGAKAVDARKGLFQSSDDIKKQYRQGLVGRSDGFNWLENELLPAHTNGNDVTFVVDGAVSVEGSTTIHVDGLTTTTGTVKKGTVFTVAGVYAVHPQTKATLTHLQPFVVTADVTADGGGDADLTVSPAMYTSASGSLQTVSAFPANDAAITVLTGSASTSYIQNLCFHKEAFRMVSVPLEMPKNAEFAAQHTEQGITVAIIRDFDVMQRRMVTRMDFLGGLVTVRPEWACRITA